MLKKSNKMGKLLLQINSDMIWVLMELANIPKLCQIRNSIYQTRQAINDLPSKSD